MTLYLRRNFFQGKDFFFKNIDLNFSCRNVIQDDNEKYDVDLAIEFPKKSI